jgi:hypothetical protein
LSLKNPESCVCEEAITSVWQPLRYPLILRDQQMIFLQAQFHATYYFVINR